MIFFVVQKYEQRLGTLTLLSISAPMISIIVAHFDYFWTLIIGNTFITGALLIMSYIPREDVSMATTILVM